MQAGQYSAPNYYRQVWQSTDGKSWSLLTNAAPFSATNLNQVVELNGKLLAFAGSDTDDTIPEVWSSPDGSVWTHVVSDDTLPKQTFGPGVSIGGNICLYPGSIGLHDVWCSSDGGTWQQRSSDVPNGAFAVLSGTVFVVGSSQSRYWSNDIVWQSADGISWRLGYQNTLRFQ